MSSDEFSDIDEDEDYYDANDRNFEADDDIDEDEYAEEEEEEDDEDDDIFTLNLDGNATNNTLTIAHILNAYMSRLRGLSRSSFEHNDNSEDDINNLHQSQLTKTNLTDEKIMSQYLSRIKEKNTTINNFLLNREMYGIRKSYPIQISNHYLPSNEFKNVARVTTKIFCCKFLNAGNTFMTASQDRVIRFYDSNSWAVKRQIFVHNVNWSIIDVDISPNQEALIYSTWSDYIYMIDLAAEVEDGEQPPQRSLDLQPSADRFCVFGLKFSRDNSQVLAGASNGLIYLYDINEGRRIAEVKGHVDDINSVCYLDSSDNLLVTASDDYYIKIWDKRTMRQSSSSEASSSRYSSAVASPVGYLTGHRRGLTHVESKGDGIYLLSNSKDCTAKLWDIRKMSTSINKISVDRSEVHNEQDYRFSGSAAPLGPTNNEKDLSLMTYAKHSVFQTLIRAHFSPIDTTAQKYIYTGSYSGDIFIYDVLTGERVRTLHQGCGPIRDLCWAPYTPQIVSTCWTGYVTTWNNWNDGRYEIMEDPNAVSNTTTNIPYSRTITVEL